MTATERFLKYIMIDTTSDEASEKLPLFAEPACSGQTAR